MGKFGNRRVPKFMEDDKVIPESHGSHENPVQIVSLGDHGDDHAMIVIKTHDGQEVELRFDYDGDGMLTAQHGDHEYSIPVEVEIVSGMEETEQIGEAKKNKGSRPDYLDFDNDGDKKESMKKALQDKKKGKAKVAETFESFVNECWSPVEDGYNPAMSEEAKRAIKTICEDLLIKEAQACDEDQDPMHTYESYLNEAGAYMTQCMAEAATNIQVK